MDNAKISHYRILEKPGAGGMGEVYLAEDMKLGRKVAIKILGEEYTTNRDRLNRFEQEACAASALNRICGEGMKQLPSFKRFSIARAWTWTRSSVH